MRKGWDGSRLETLTRVRALACAEPHVSLIGHITRSELRADLMPKETANGFGNRFLWVHARRQRSLPDGGTRLDFSEFHERLRSALGGAKTSGEMTRDRSASALWAAVYPSLTLDRDDLFGRMTARGAPQVVRLSCLFALGDGSTVVRQPHLRAALEFWRYSCATIGYLWGDGFGDARADALLAALKAARRQGLTQSEILREVFQRNVKADDLARVGAMLQSAGLLERRLDSSDGGRPAMRWFYREPVPAGDDIDIAERDSGSCQCQKTNDSNDRSPTSKPDSGTSVVDVVASSDSSEDVAAREDADERAAIQAEDEDVETF
jgi:hypothetical protein